MKLSKIKSVLSEILKVFLISFGLIGVAAVMLAFYVGGFFQGYKLAKSEIDTSFLNFLDGLIDPQTRIPTSTLSPLPSSTRAAVKSSAWGGPELWQAVNKKRSELGVNPLSIKSDLCTISSIRLNELLELGKLDGHEGFSTMRESRPDLKWIFDNFSNISEFLAVGGQSAGETVALWENTLGHRKLVDGGEYVWGCIYAQDTFAVAIVAY